MVLGLALLLAGPVGTLRGDTMKPAGLLPSIELPVYIVPGASSDAPAAIGQDLTVIINVTDPDSSQVNMSLYWDFLTSTFAINPSSANDTQVVTLTWDADHFTWRGQAVFHHTYDAIGPYAQQNRSGNTSGTLDMGAYFLGIIPDDGRCGGPCDPVKVHGEGWDTITLAWVGPPLGNQAPLMLSSWNSVLTPPPLQPYQEYLTVNFSGPFGLLFMDPDGDPLTITWSFGDGQSQNKSFPATSPRAAISMETAHTYYLNANYSVKLPPDPLRYTVSAVVQDDHGHATRASPDLTLIVTLYPDTGPQSLTLTYGPTRGPGEDPFVFVGGDVAFVGSARDYENDPLKMSWDFDGDGSIDALGATVHHVFTTPARYNVTLHVSDGDWKLPLAAHNDSTARQVWAKEDEAPILAPLSPVMARAGSSVSFWASALDPDGDQLNWTWGWGDGTTTRLTTVGDTLHDQTAAANHTYLAEGNYTLNVTIDDGWGHVVTSSTYVVISAENHAPVLDLNLSTTAYVGEPTTMVFLLFDADQDNLSLSIDYGDGTGDTFTGIPTRADVWAAVTVHHTYAAPDYYLLTATATDPQGASAEVQTYIGVFLQANFSPSVNVSAPDRATLGQPIAITIWVMDPEGDTLDVTLSVGSNYSVVYGIHTQAGVWQAVPMTFTPSYPGYLYGLAWATDNLPGHYPIYSHFFIYVTSPPSYTVTPVRTFRAEILALEEVVGGAVIRVDKASFPTDYLTLNLYINGKLSFSSSRSLWYDSAGTNITLLGLGAANATGNFTLRITSQFLGTIYETSGGLLPTRATASVSASSVNLGDDITVSLRLDLEGPAVVMAPYDLRYAVDGRWFEETAFVFAFNQSGLPSFPSILPITVPRPNAGLSYFASARNLGLGVGPHNITVEVVDPILNTTVLHTNFPVVVNNPFHKRIKALQDQLDQIQQLLAKGSAEAKAQARTLLIQAKADLDRLRSDVAALGARASDVLQQVDDMEARANSLEGQAGSAEPTSAPWFTGPNSTLAFAVGLGAVAGALGGALVSGRRRRRGS